MRASITTHRTNSWKLERSKCPAKPPITPSTTSEKYDGEPQADQPGHRYTGNTPTSSIVIDDEPEVSSAQSYGFTG
jgi:hypothetical protein